MNKTEELRAAFVSLAGVIASLGTEVCDLLDKQEQDMIQIECELDNVKHTVKHAAQSIIDSL